MNVWMWDCHFCSHKGQVAVVKKTLLKHLLFTGLSVVDITFVMDHRGRRKTGEAFVQFATPEMANQALLKHKEEIGNRYVAIRR